jgi:hypothetical protein
MTTVTMEKSRKLLLPTAHNRDLCLRFGELRVRNVVPGNMFYCGDKDSGKCVVASIQRVSLSPYPELYKFQREFNYM